MVLYVERSGAYSTLRSLPDLFTRRRREHCKNPNAAGQSVWVSAREWGRLTEVPRVSTLCLSFRQEAVLNGEQARSRAVRRSDLGVDLVWLCVRCLPSPM
jgi:hypothetical protein